MAQRGFGGFGDYSNLGNFANNAFSRLRSGTMGGFPSDAVKDLGLGDMLQGQVGTDTDWAREEHPHRQPRPHPSPHGRTVPLGAEVYESSHVVSPLLVPAARCKQRWSPPRITSRLNGLRRV